MVFVAAGALLGPAGVDVLPVALDKEAALTITELTLALLLFADASGVRLRAVEGDRTMPERLLFIGLPLTVIAGALLAQWMFADMTWATALLVATILAPTDAALGLAVVTDRAVPVRIRRALNVESGLNDGIMTPFVTLFIAVVASEKVCPRTIGASKRSRRSASRSVRPSSWGLSAGKRSCSPATRGGHLRCRRSSRYWRWRSSPTGARSRSEATGSSPRSWPGSCSAPRPTASSMDRSSSRRRSACSRRSSSGRCSAPSSWDRSSRTTVSATAIAYALLSLTVVRMLPVALALIGKHLRVSTLAFMGWFGPRGLASVIFTLIALDELKQSGPLDTLVVVATWTILLSVVLHGISATPLAARYGASIEKLGAGTPELAPAKEPSIRLRDLAGRHRPHKGGTTSPGGELAGRAAVASGAVTQSIQMPVPPLASASSIRGHLGADNTSSRHRTFRPHRCDIVLIRRALLAALHGARG